MAADNSASRNEKRSVDTAAMEKGEAMSDAIVHMLDELRQQRQR
jgi:hypothetical protein